MDFRVAAIALSMRPVRGKVVVELLSKELFSTDRQLVLHADDGGHAPLR